MGNEINNEIEEMAKIVKQVVHKYFSNEIANLLYSAGYRKQSEWISVKDRLPSETRDYLVVLNNEDVDIRLFNSKNDPYQTWSSMLNKFLFLDNKGDWHSTDRVTHWMPLPKAPKEE